MFTGRVYKIIHNQSDIVYIGSTKNELRYRWKEHKKSFQKWVTDKEKQGTCSIYPYFEKYGTESFKIILVKEYEVCDKKHLEAKEQLWINKLRCINQRNLLPLPTKVQQKNKYLKKRDHYLSKQKNYRETHEEQIKNKKTLKTFCDCGANVLKDGLARHKRSKKHQESISEH
jgi:hypothetical protein